MIIYLLGEKNERKQDNIRFLKKIISNLDKKKQTKYGKKTDMDLWKSRIMVNLIGVYKQGLDKGKEKTQF